MLDRNICGFLLRQPTQYSYFTSYENAHLKLFFLWVLYIKIAALLKLSKNRFCSLCWCCSLHIITDVQPLHLQQQIVMCHCWLRTLGKKYIFLFYSSKGKTSLSPWLHLSRRQRSSRSGQGKRKSFPSDSLIAKNSWRVSAPCGVIMHDHTSL